MGHFKANTFDRYLNYNICVYITDILTYICITTPDFKNERSFDFLMKLHLQFHADFAEETQRYEQNMTFPLKFEMDKAFSFYIEHTMKLYNRTASEREIDYSFDDQDDSPIEEFVLDEEKTRSRIKTPLLVQSVYDIKSIDFGLTKVSSSRSIFISWLMKHSYISIAICVTVGLGSLVLVILKLLNKI